MTAERIVPLHGTIKINFGAMLRAMGMSPGKMLWILVLTVAYNTLNRIKELRIW
jgi:hypothetical protein